MDQQEESSLRSQQEGRHLSAKRTFEALLDLLAADVWHILNARAITALSPSQGEAALAMAAHLVHWDRIVTEAEMRLLTETAHLAFNGQPVQRAAGHAVAPPPGGRG
jgi:hypothetical protein